MTDTTPSGMVGPRVETGTNSGLRIGSALWICLAASILMWLPNLADPMIRHDDFPALFGDAHDFWSKTLHEGRWLSYLWHLRGVYLPHWVNFAVYAAAWAVFAAATATVVTRNRGETFYTVMLALMILVSTPMVSISLWYNTLVPGLALVALYALLACRLSGRATLALLPGFVVLTFMSYTTYPLLLLAVCLFRQERRSLSNLAAVLAVFGGSFAAAVLVTYSINWMVHGVFGVPLADWRQATPAEGLSGMMANLPKLTATFLVLARHSNYDIDPAGILYAVLFLVTLIALWRNDRKLALYIQAGLLTGVTLAAVQVLKLGIALPLRTFVFISVFFAITIVRGAQEMNKGGGLQGRIARAVVVTLVLAGLAIVHKQMRVYQPWQAESRELALTLQTMPDPIFVIGNPMLIASGHAAGLQREVAFGYRLRLVTGRMSTQCGKGYDACTIPEGIPAEPAVVTPSGVTIRTGPAGTVVDFSPAEVPGPDA
jgi:hypothetical protein